MLYVNHAPEVGFSAVSKEPVCGIWKDPKKEEVVKKLRGDQGFGWERGVTSCMLRPCLGIAVRRKSWRSRRGVP